MSSVVKSSNDRLIHAFDENILNKDYYENMNYFLIDSLEQLAAIKVVVSLCQREEIKAVLDGSSQKASSASDMKPFFAEWGRFSWCNDIEKGLAAIADKLFVPSPIQKSLPPIVRLVSYELSRWMRSLKNYIDQKLFFGLIQHIVWRPDGFINDFETAKRIVIDSRLESKLKFKLVCLYSLKDCVDACSRDSFDPQYKEKLNFEENPLEFYWTSYVVDNLTEVKKKIPKNFSGSLNDYLITVLDGLELPGCLYFWSELNDERKIHCAQYFTEEFGFGTMLVVCSQLNEAQQLELFRLSAESILCMSLGQVHLMRYFLPMAYRSRDVISQKHFIEVLKAFAEDDDYLCTRDKYSTFYIKMIVEFWCFVPSTLRSFALAHERGHFMDSITMDLVEDMKNNVDQMIRLFSCVEYKSRKEFICSLKRRDEWASIIFEDDVTHECLLKFLNSTLTPSDVKQFFGMFTDAYVRGEEDFYIRDYDYYDSDD